MPELIIGHTTEKTARVWVRGDKPHIWVRIRRHSEEGKLTLRKATVEEPINTFPIALTAAADYTSTIDITDLEPGVEYLLNGTFGRVRAPSTAGSIPSDQHRTRRTRSASCC
jgi:hypothetical protein